MTTTQTSARQWPALVLTVALAGCGVDTRDPNPFRSYEDGCSIEEAFACADTTLSVADNGVRTKRITAWDPGRRTFLEAVFTNEGLADDRSFLHHYDADLRDSVIYWVAGLDSGGATYKGWTTYSYDAAGNRSMVVLYNAGGIPYDTTHYYPDGTERTPCRPFTGGPCREEFRAATPGGGTVERVLSWDPVNAVYTELAFSSGRLLPERSSVHHYNQAGLDSVVYWVESGTRTGELTYSGRGVYHNDDSGRLRRIDFYHTNERQPYGHLRYDDQGRVRERMEDGHVTVLDTLGNTVQEHGVAQ